MVGLLVLVVWLCAACGGTVAPPQTGTQPPPELPPSGPPPPVTFSWSEWPGGTPVAGQDVTVPAGQTVLLDVSPPELGDLTIEGTLVFADTDLELTAASIMVHGALFVGSSDNPFSHQATITLTGQRTAAAADGMGDRVLGSMNGGRIELHGGSVHSWTVLRADARPGDRHVTVADASGWQAGDRIVIATTDFPQWDGDGAVERQTEERVLTAVNGNRLEFSEPLGFFHVGELMNVAGVSVDQRAEVARLNRNIVVQGPESTLDPSAADYRFGGHIMIMPRGSGRFSGVELRRMGQAGILARYPVHWHLVRDGGEGSYIRHSAVTDSFNRCVTIHGTNHVVVYDVVGYANLGHCFFLEDGAETGNVLQHNLSLNTRRPAPQDVFLPSDADYLGPAGFWITHPGNDLLDNRAVGSMGTGFWYALPEHPTGDYRRAFPADAEQIFPRNAPLGLFADNTAHSNQAIGLHVDNGPTADVLHNPPASYRPRNAAGEPVTAVFDNFNAWRNRNAGAWFRGSDTVLRGGVLSDNPIGVTFASNRSWATGVSFIGQTPNSGDPRSWEPSAALGISVGRPWDPDFVVRGFEFYDGDVAVTDSFFAAYGHNGFQDAVALSYKDFTAFSVSPLNHTAGLRFAAGTQRVWLTSRSPEPDEPADGYRSALFIDQDGSVTGTRGAVVTANNPFMHAAGCELNAEWNSVVCPPSVAFAALTLWTVPDGLGPVTISRADGVSHVMLGRHAPEYRTNLLLDGSYSYSFSGSASHMRLNLTDIPAGTLLHVSLPWSGGAPYIYRDWWIDGRNLLTAHDSLQELRDSGASGYFFDGSRLHLNLLERDGRGYAQVEICRVELCR